MPNEVKLRVEDNIELGIKATTYAIREMLMEYFKGTCTIRTTEGNVQLYPHRPSAGRHYVQHIFNLETPANVLIGDQFIATVKHSPDTITLHLGTLKRSKVMREIHTRVNLFLEKYLRGVTVRTDEAGTREWRNDKRLILENKPLLPKDETKDMSQHTYSMISNNTMIYEPMPTLMQYHVADVLDDDLS